MNPTPPLTDAEIEARLVQSFTAHEPLVDPGRATDLTRTAYAAPRTARSTFRWLAAAAAVAILGGGAYAARTAVVDRAPDHPAGRPVAGGTTSASASAAAGGPYSDPGTRAAADAAIAHSWSVVPMLPGAQQVSKSPDPSLADQSLFIGGNAAHDVKWWVAPGTLADALTYLRAHPPTGFDPQAGGGDVTDAQMHKIGEMVFWDGTGGETTSPSGEVGQTTLAISVITHGTGVALRVDSLAKYRPARPADLWLDPATVTGAHVTFVSGGSRGAETSHGADLTAQQARDIIELVNAQLPSFDMGDHSCPASTSVKRDELTLRTNSKPVVVNVGLGCGGGIRIGVNTASSRINLTGDVEVDAALRRAAP